MIEMSICDNLLYGLNKFSNREIRLTQEEQVKLGSCYMMLLRMKVEGRTHSFCIGECKDNLRGILPKDYIKNRHQRGVILQQQIQILEYTCTDSEMILLYFIHRIFLGICSLLGTTKGTLNMSLYSRCNKTDNLFYIIRCNSGGDFRQIQPESKHVSKCSYQSDIDVENTFFKWKGETRGQ